MIEQVILKLKIGRHSYEITKDDKFMDNGACIQLLTQSKEADGWGKYRNPKLSKRSTKEIGEFKRVECEHGFSDRVSIFHLEIPSE